MVAGGLKVAESIRTTPRDGHSMVGGDCVDGTAGKSHLAKVEGLR